MNESIWKEIRCYFYDDEEHVWVVDAWLTEDDNEPGDVVAKINGSGKVTYLDKRAEKDPYAQEIIAEKIKSIKEDAALEDCVKNLIDEIDKRLSNAYKVLEGTSDTLYVKERSTGKHLEIKVTELAD